MTEQPKSQPEPQAQPAVDTTAALELNVAKLTDVGRARPHNEDYVDCRIPPDPQQLARRGSIFLVADGMGGHQAGEVASRGAVEAVMENYFADASHDVPTSLVRAFRYANQKLHAQAQADSSKGGMGTTLVAAVVLGRKVYVANVGDSRAYLINRTGITQITEDHSWVEEQVRAGLLTMEQARRHPQRNLVTRALSSKPSVEVDLFEGEINAGDTILLCSDGLTGRVEDAEIAAIVRQHPPHQAAEKLVALANERGGNDNITVLVVNAQEEAATVKAPALAPPIKKKSKRSPLVPVLGGIVLLVLLGLGAVLAAPYLFGTDATPTPTLTATASEAEPTPAATDTILPSPQASATEESTPAGAATTEPAVTPEPTSTLAQAPTASNTPLPTDTPPATPTPTATPTATPRFSHQPPTLVQPQDNASLRGSVTFEWSYPQGALGAGNAFQVLIWNADENPEEPPGAAGFVETVQQEINLDDVLPSQSGVQYYWSVVVVERATQKRISEKALPRIFTYDGPENEDGSPSTGSEGSQPPQQSSCQNFTCSEQECCGERPNQCCSLICPGFTCP
ncbi:MAG: Stp1/IreP family PP2C-type Ser/Thr phosphatase [Anaerolineae bacterium]|jgi:serine/threonine protein phosphatase PrpC